MNRKVLAFILCITCALLVACGSLQNSIDGKYYSVRKGETKLVLEIDGDAGKYYVGDSVYPITSVDVEKKQFTVSGFIEVVMMYELSNDGQIEVVDGSFHQTCYKENSKALKKAIEETQKENE